MASNSGEENTRFRVERPSSESADVSLVNDQKSWNQSLANEVIRDTESAARRYFVEHGMPPRSTDK